MELQTIVNRYAMAIEYVDARIAHSGANTRTGLVYMPGFKSLNEEPAIDAIDDAWEHMHPGERLVHKMKVRYPELQATAKIDHVITTDALGPDYEWGIEVKRLQFAGDNGKRNDFATTKMLSPYLKDRGLLHDALRLREYGFTRRIAVIGYGFDYDERSLAYAGTLHIAGQAAATVQNIAATVARDGPLYNRPLIEFADAILRLRGWTTGPRAEAPFAAWQHPAGGKGVVFGWEVRRPQADPDYDPRNPW